MWAPRALWQALGHTHKLSFLRKNGRSPLHFIGLFGCALGWFQSRPAPWRSSNEQTSGSGHESCHSWSMFSVRLREQVSKWAELWYLWNRSSIALRSSRGTCNRSSNCLLCSVFQECGVIRRALIFLAVSTFHLDLGSSFGCYNSLSFRKPSVRNLK